MALAKDDTADNARLTTSNLRKHWAASEDLSDIAKGNCRGNQSPFDFWENNSELELFSTQKGQEVIEVTVFYDVIVMIVHHRGVTKLNFRLINCMKHQVVKILLG